jgi:hypothetical protein
MNNRRVGIHEETKYNLGDIFVEKYDIYLGDGIPSVLLNVLLDQTSLIDLT